MTTMELASSSSSNKPVTSHTDGFEISSNWKIINDRLLHNTISTGDVQDSPDEATLEDIVSLNTCIRLEGDINEKRAPCHIDIKFTNGQKIARVAIVSEAVLIELYKQFGEYVTTEHTEFIDEFEDSAVYLTNIGLSPPSPEITIKFARLKNPGNAMWLYGVRLSLTKPMPNASGEMFDHNVISKLLPCKKTSTTKSEWAKELLESAENPNNQMKRDMDSLLHNFMSFNINSQRRQQCGKGPENQILPQQENLQIIGDCASIHDSSLKTYIDEKLRDMEEKLMKRIEKMDRANTEKLDSIIKLLEDKTVSN